MYCDEMNRSISVFLTAVGPFSNTLKHDFVDREACRMLLIEVRGLCAEIEKNSAAFSQRLESRLKLLEFGRARYESSHLQLLSLLAAIFLPLSLASSILSMQTRFADLGYLLYFFGVILLLATLTTLIVGVLVLVRKGSQNLRKFIETEPTLRAALIGLLLTMILIPWMLILSSLLVGMFKSVGLGVKILSAGLGVLVVVMVGIITFVRFISVRMR
ncbi:hypothetical protein BU23DRAFT_13068 [Bimuria novae-zelandiae CBS 107.79]|uniref:Uncharacterized protein n=1 Tax=Bimuria novae-zelandiae CBS 107.79 TaxID=1447943 RepID=A0A6A5VPL6_9PLEO|nr:hypothetical protein BU23DRAFT_13068 [Bimuria novae-zelandiae CBS 107.79]